LQLSSELVVCEKSEHKPVQLSFFRLVYLEINPILSVNPVNKLRVYVGKTENHRGTTSLFTRTFSRLAEKTTSKQRDRSEM